MTEDKLIVKDLRVYGYHGVNKDENEQGQPFIVDLTCYMDMSRPCRSDNINETVNYAEMVVLVSKVIREKTYNIIEYVAQQIAEAVLKEYREIKRIDVLLKKPRAPILADFGYVAVEITRER